MTVFVDVNIFMYAAGAPHPSKDPCLRLLQRMADEAIEAMTDSEALQELLYRFWHLRRLEEGITIVESAVQSMSRVLPVTAEDVLLARTLLRAHGRVEPRDAIHAAVMLNHGLTDLYSYDRHFDRIPGLKRLEP